MNFEKRLDEALATVSLHREKVAPKKIVFNLSEDGSQGSLGMVNEPVPGGDQNLSIDQPDPLPPIEDGPQPVEGSAAEDRAESVGNVVEQLNGLLGDEKWTALGNSIGITAPEIAEHQITDEETGESTTLGEMWESLGKIAKEFPTAIAQINEQVQQAMKDRNRQAEPVESPSPAPSPDLGVSQDIPQVPDLDLQTSTPLGI